MKHTTSCPETTHTNFTMWRDYIKQNIRDKKLSEDGDIQRLWKDAYDDRGH